MKAPLRLENLSEAEFDRLLFTGPKSVAKSVGWSTYHVLRAKGSAPGFPDRVCWRERTIFVETKGPKTRIDPAQMNVLDGLARAGSEVYLWRPADFDEAGLVLGRRWRFKRELPGAPYLFLPDQPAWTPGGLWIPGVGRADSR